MINTKAQCEDSLCFVNKEKKEKESVFLIIKKRKTLSLYKTYFFY
jgi:hypothetical protein